MRCFLGPEIKRPHLWWGEKGKGRLPGGGGTGAFRKTDRGVCGRREGGSKCVGGVSEAHSSPGDFKSLDLGGGF